MRILLMAPSFFGYRYRVRDELARRGHAVDCVDDRPSEGIAFKSLSRVGIGLVGGMVASHAGRVRDQVASGGYDLILYMGGMSFCFTPGQLRAIRESSDARFTAYLWDSLANCRRLVACLGLFDEILSFDPVDCHEHGFALRPLFYSDVWSRVPLEPEGGFEYDACFVGSVHQPSKFKAVTGICDELERRGLRVFRYFFMPSRSAEALRRATYPPYRGVAFEQEPLSAEQVAGVFARSRAVIDAPQTGQCGLTMRTVEAIGARRRLITSNRDVMRYDFACSGDVAVWDGPDSVAPGFFERPYAELPEGVYGSYSIEAFADALLGEGARYDGYEVRG